MAVEQAAHDLATRLEMPKLVGSLQDVLGQDLVALIVGISDVRDVGAWARSERVPGPDAEWRLRSAFQVAQLLLRYESAETVRAWWLGMNPELDDRAPALVLAEDPASVLEAARAFLAYG